jgi:putative transposase
LLSVCRRHKRSGCYLLFRTIDKTSRSKYALGMNRRKIHDDELHAHYVTFSCYRRRRLLDHDGAKRVVLGVLNSQLLGRKARCVGFVVMPNHVHAIVWFPQPGQLSVFMQQWKRLSSHHIGLMVRDKLIHYAEHIHGKQPFWQAKYYPFNLYSEEKVREKLTYMHENPVRAGLVEKPCDWVYSSARYYEQGRSVGVPIHWIA